MQTEHATDTASWDRLVTTHNGHPLQLWGWGEVKASHGWTATRLVVRDAAGKVVGGAQILERRIPVISRTIAYIPRGPWCEQSDREMVLDEIASWMKARSRTIGILIEPDWEGENVSLRGWTSTNQTILVASTLRLDLQNAEERLLGAMAKKTRQYIRKSAKDITIENVTDSTGIEECLTLYKETARRAGFGLHSDAYYHDLYERLGDANRVYIARDNGEALAFLWLVESTYVAFELYGGVNQAGQRLRANYALKWHAIVSAKNRGVAIYDVNGLLNDNITSFKTSFASHTNQLIGAYYHATSPLYYVWIALQPVAKITARLLAKIR